MDLGTIKRPVMSSRPENYSEIFPIEISPYGAKKVHLLVKFEGVYLDFLDRCWVSINPLNPKKWEWQDLPIVVNLAIDTTNKRLDENTVCIFREDLEESNEIVGTYGLLGEFEAIQKFSPKIDFEKLLEGK
ncbi:hypothetical protein GQS_01935 [Thermococcus sp. 4557]|uniref:hypothetical protein n=1 Tax=Thermococcus sp. (strain CGMCC 1.5172 / 4557) TaxID=1042877 RepID=UPI000219ECD2|nr:hypothetical protein [Thermococcus sp. 4557]AEK72289.1 hypothetical protein GQS_01935 [Thermococcus sp. 4557]